MSNKISSCIDAIVTALEALKTGSPPTLRTVGRRMVNPQQATLKPACGVVLSDFHREDQTWIANLLIQLVAQGGADVDQEIIALVASVEAAIATLADGGTAGGIIDRPDFSVAASEQDDGTYQPTSCVGKLRIRVEDPLVVA